MKAFLKRTGEKMQDHKRRVQEDARFSLHDAKVIDMDFEDDKKTLVFKTQNGFVDIEKNKVVQGEVGIEGTSLEDSYVYIMEYKNVLTGNIGSFIGEKMNLLTFISAFHTKFLSFDIMSEYDSYKTYVLSGFLSRGEDDLEARIEIFYWGDFVYRVLEDE